MDQDTAIGGRRKAFPETRRSVVLAARSEDADERRRASAAIVEAYWKPVYKYVRIKWRASNEDAKDLTQGFFAQAIEKGWFGRFDPSRARFRTYVRICVDGWVANQRKAARRRKRGGDVELLSLDFEDAERELRRLEVADGVDLDQLFYDEWVRSLFGLAVEELRQWCDRQGKQTHFALFEAYDLDRLEDGDPVTYDDLARRFELPVTQVTNWLAVARRRFRELVLAKLEELCASRQEFESEARRLLGVEPSPAAPSPAAAVEPRRSTDIGSRTSKNVEARPSVGIEPPPAADTSAAEDVPPER